MVEGYEELTLQYNKKDIIISPSTETENCIIFYPGAMVESKAYLPLLLECAQKTNTKCVLIDMPAKLAFNRKNAAKTYRKKYSSSIKNFYLAGHSLGGAMAGSFISEQKSGYAGLILLAAYSTEKIPSEVKVLSVYGSEDKVLNKKNYNKYKSNLPSDFTEIVINGGNHGNFGNYGHQKGDGNAAITNEEQQKITVEAIGAFIQKEEAYE